jgi:flagellar hook-length control protein FliK
MINNLNQSSPVETSQTLSATPAATPNKKAQSKDGSKSSASSNETFDQQLQQQGAIANAQANAPVQASQVNLSKAALSLGTQAQAMPAEGKEGVVLLAQPKAALAHMNVAEYSPGTAKSAAGLNAGSSVAGLKPWNQEWVFEGMERPIREGEEIRPLIGGGSQAEELAQVQAALKQLNMMAGAPQANGLRSRGEQGLEKAGPTGGMDADALVAVNARIASQLPQQLGAEGGAVNLEQAISQMNGEVLGQPRSQLSDKLAPQGANTGAVPGLAGSEFIKTLTLVRGQNGAEAPVIGEEQVEGGGNRADLKLVDDSLGGQSKKSFSDFASAEDALSSPYALHSVGLSGAQQNFAAPAPVVVTGHVVPGAGVQDQLSHEAVANVSAGIKSLGQNGGEMKIHLRPEGLGELHVKVITQGQQVGLQIQASDENARKILQDSMSTLKESMASQNLSLAKVDISIAHAFSGNDASHSQNQHQQHQSGQPLFMNSDRREMFGQNPGQQNQGGARWGENSNGDGLSARPMRGMAAASARSAMAGAGAGSGMGRMDGRLDVLA